jgi:2,3-bisphosphoglycerate-dependent phosphoglycerate mutase
MASSILLIRHARPVPPLESMSEDEDNERALTPEGRVDAERLAERLADEAVAAVFSSPYRRALETVQPIAARHEIDVHVHVDLRERRVSGGGPLPEQAFLDALQRARRDPDFSLPGGESTQDVLERVSRVIREIHESTPEGVAVIGTHGGVISILRWSLGDQFTVEEALAEPMPSAFRLGNLDGDWDLERV